MSKHPVTFLVQFLACLSLFAVLLVTGLGVSHPSDREKDTPLQLSKIHPSCLNRLFIDQRYEGSINVEICNTEFQKQPIKINTVQSFMGKSEQIEVSSTRIDKEGKYWTTTYRMAEEEQRGPFLLTIFHKFPDGVELSSIGGVSFDTEKNILTAHFMNGGNDRCKGGNLEVMGMINRKVIAISQSATPYALLNPLDKLVEEKEKSVQTTFPDWNRDVQISDSPESCVGRLIGTYEPLTKKTSISAVAVDLKALLLSASNSLESCISDAIVRADVTPVSTDNDYSIYSAEGWNEVLFKVHARCGSEETFQPLQAGI